MGGQAVETDHRPIISPGEILVGFWGVKPKTISTGDACIDVSTIVGIRKDSHDTAYGDTSTVHRIVIDRCDGHVFIECKYSNAKDRDFDYGEWVQAWSGRTQASNPSSDKGRHSSTSSS